MIQDKQVALLEVIIDPDRRRILEIIVRNPPQSSTDLINLLDLPKPEVEKHLEKLRDFLLLEREMEKWPGTKYVWKITSLGNTLIDHLLDFLDGYFLQANTEVSRRSDQLEEQFILGRIERDQFKEESKILERVRKNLAGMGTRSDYLEEALTIRKEHEKNL